jgi:hypothetical protein
MSFTAISNPSTSRPDNSERSSESDSMMMKVISNAKNMVNEQFEHFME